MRVRNDEMSLTQTAAVLGVDRATVWRWLRRKIIASRARSGHLVPVLASVVALRAQRDLIAKLKDTAKRAKPKSRKPTFLYAGGVTAGRGRGKWFPFIIGRHGIENAPRGSRNADLMVKAHDVHQAWSIATDWHLDAA